MTTQNPNLTELEQLKAEYEATKARLAESEAKAADAAKEAERLRAASGSSHKLGFATLKSDGLLMASMPKQGAAGATNTTGDTCSMIACMDFAMRDFRALVHRSCKECGGAEAEFTTEKRHRKSDNAEYQVTMVGSPPVMVCKGEKAGQQANVRRWLREVVFAG